MQKIVGVRRIKDRELYYFYQNIEDLKLGEKLVVNFDDFQTIVTVAKLGMTIEDDKAQELKKILRRATDSDIKKYESLLDKAKGYLPAIKKKSLELGLVMKFVTAEYSLDNSKILIVFSSEERVDFRQLLKELVVMLKVRIELKQIGQRDEAKICSSVGICGQQCCCARFLKEFEHVTVKMAKNQGLSLAPTKINGVCGRLMCCLGYESSYYEEMLKKMPKVGSEIQTPEGLATVQYCDVLREKVTVKRKSEGDTFVVEDFTLEELAQGRRIVADNENDDKKKEKVSVSDKIDEIIGRSAELLSDENNNANNVKIEKVQNNVNNDKNKAQNHQKKNNFNKNHKNTPKDSQNLNNQGQNSELKNEQSKPNFNYKKNKMNNKNHSQNFNKNRAGAVDAKSKNNNQ